MKSYFPRIYGNTSTKARLSTQINNGTLPHAFLIGGAAGSGKTTLALELAAALNCANRDKDGFPLPCGVCNACRRIYDGNFPDIKTLSKPKDKASLGVEPVKDFREDMFLSSTESNYKIYVIDDAESMTTEAQNALLKVLEEPPLGVIIIMLAKECDKILTTIKSRVQYIAMARFNKQELEKHLLYASADARELKASSPQDFDAVLMRADGNLYEAIKLSNKKYAAECFDEHSDTLRMIKCITEKTSYKDIHEAFSYLPSKRTERQKFVDALERLISALRDLIVSKEAENAPLIFFNSHDEAKKACAGASLKKLVSAYDEICICHDLCMKNANISNIISTLEAKIKFI